VETPGWPEEHAGGPKKEDEETTRTKNIFLSVLSLLER
jgi:hypothetical protein